MITMFAVSCALWGGFCVWAGDYKGAVLLGAGALSAVGLQRVVETES